MNYPKNAGVYCIADFQLKYTPFQELGKQKFQEEANEICLCQFSKMGRWVEITSTPTNPQRESW
jgi:hypothetical protein